MPAFQITSTSTLQSIVDTCCTLLSLAKETSAVGATDPAKVLLVQSANLASLELSTAYEWTDLIRHGEIQVVSSAVPPAGIGSEIGFPLPVDFDRFVDQTQWNGSSQMPALGPVRPQGWQAYMQFPIGTTFTLTWQVREGKVWFLDPPPAPGHTFRFMYMSNAIVRDADDPNLFKNIARKDGDQFLLDPLLILLLTRLKWLEAKGFDSSSAARDFSTSWDARVGMKRGAQVLDMSGARSANRLLDASNLPETGYAIPR